MSTYGPAETALLLVDIQKGFQLHSSNWGKERSTPAFASNIVRLLSAFRKSGSPIFHVCHHSTAESSPLHPSKEGVELADFAAAWPSEPVFPKSTSSPFGTTDLEAVIRKHNVKRLVVAGLTTPHCVSSTVRMASMLRVVEHSYGTPATDDARRGAIVVVSDATAAFDVEFDGKRYDAETVQAVHLATFKNEFCDVENTDEVCKQLEL